TKATEDRKQTECKQEFQRTKVLGSVEKGVITMKMTNGKRKGLLRDTRGFDFSLITEHGLAWVIGILLFGVAAAGFRRVCTTVVQETEDKLSTGNHGPDWGKKAAQETIKS